MALTFVKKSEVFFLMNQAHMGVTFNEIAERALEKWKQFYLTQVR